MKIRIENADGTEMSIKALITGFIKNTMPAGGGFDADWEVELVGSKAIIKSEFHVMNENGFYDGWVSFSYTIDDIWGDDWWEDSGKLRLHGKESHYLERKYLVREYIDESIYNCLNEVNSPFDYSKASGGFYENFSR